MYYTLSYIIGVGLAKTLPLVEGNKKIFLFYFFHWMRPLVGFALGLVEGPKLSYTSTYDTQDW